MITAFKHLNSGSKYVVTKSFIDASGAIIKKGQFLNYLKTEFLPYDEEYTLIFQEKELCLNENINSEVIKNINVYLTKV